MGTRAWAFTAVLLVSVTSAIAGPKEDIQKKTTEAMENYDLMDYDAAKKLLNQALAIAKKSKLDKEPATATVYLDLGLAAFAAGDAESARVAFISAVEIDPKIQISAAYKSPDVAKLLEEARGNSDPKIEMSPEVTDTVDCGSVTGLQHTLIDTAPRSKNVPVEALLAPGVTANKVVVMFRAEGTTDFTEVRLTKQGNCKYTGSIPSSALKRGSAVHYYVGAYDSNNKVLASKGSSGSPNILELTGAASVKSVIGDENPIDNGISTGVIRGGKKPRVMLTVAGGTGFGYVSGATEGGNQVEKCCVGSSLAVVTPELAYYASPKLSIGVAVRIGLPVGANVNAENAEGHSTIAPAGLVRIRYALSPSGQGVRVMGQAGYGVMRNTIKLETGMDGMDTDIVAQGPILIGGGLGYIKRLGGRISFVADASALVGLKTSEKVGTTRVNTGLGADVSLGLAVGF